MAELLVNPNFEGPNNRPGFDGWTRVNDKWKGSKKVANPSPMDTAAEMDQDVVRDGVLVGWVSGDEDWLSQEVDALDPHGFVVFGITEIHHVTESIAKVRLYGLENGEWVVIWERNGLGSIPAATSQYSWYTNLYPVQSNHTKYKLEFYGKYLSEDGKDGWKFTLLSLKTYVSLDKPPRR